VCASFVYLSPAVRFSRPRGRFASLPAREEDVAVAPEDPYGVLLLPARIGRRTVGGVGWIRFSSPAGRTGASGSTIRWENRFPPACGGTKLWVQRPGREIASALRLRGNEALGSTTWWENRFLPACGGNEASGSTTWWENRFRPPLAGARSFGFNDLVGKSLPPRLWGERSFRFNDLVGKSLPPRLWGERSFGFNDLVGKSLPPPACGGD